MYIYSRTETFIYHFLKTHYINNPYELSMEGVANSMNLSIEYWDDTSESVCWRGRCKMFLEKRESKEEQWQEFAHELCHILWHAGRQEHLMTTFVELQEWQADYFAYHFCIPTFMLSAMDLPRYKSEAVGVVHKAFKVEPEFAEKRLDIWLQQREGFMFQKSMQRR